MTRGRFAALFVTTVLCLTVPACAWDDTTESRDMPWLGRGGRARWFYKRSECFMCPTGYTSENRWGSSAWSGHEPYGTVQAAFRFLMKAKGFRETWPEAHGEGSVGGADADVIDPRAAPYRFTVVMIEPTVVVMRFDLGALVKLGSPVNEQVIGTPWLNQSVEYGTHIPATGTLLWFSPELDQAPTPVASSAPDRANIVVRDATLTLVRTGDEWVVSREP